MRKEQIIEAIRGKLIVSCQALESEPMYSPTYPIMKHFALAAMQGGAGGIRANTVRDILAIKEEVPLPVIGIIKREYPDSPIYITPTLAEVEELMGAGPEIIAFDATWRKRPGGVALEEMTALCRQKYPHQVFMADCSTLEEGVRAQELGFDLIGTTLAGYTDATRGMALPNFDLMKALVQKGCKVVAEGGICTPRQLKATYETGVHAAVVGSAITRPLEITRRFFAAVPQGDGGQRT